MKFLSRIVLIISLSILILPILNAQDITGDWYGLLKMPDPIRINLHIWRDKKGLKATYDSPDNERFGREITKITFDNDTLFLEIPHEYIIFKGWVNEDYTRIEGAWQDWDNINGLNFGRKKLLRILRVDTGSLTIRPAKTRVVKAGDPRKIAYTGTKVVKAGNPKVIEIDTSKLTVLSPGKDTVAHPIIYKFPEPVTDSESPYQIGNNRFAPVITRAIQPEPIPEKTMRMRDAACINIQYLDVDKTLSFRVVESIMEDSKGNIWFSSLSAGIGKYDGKSLIHYTTNEGLPILTSTSFLEDRNGNIWIGMRGVICKYDGESFTHYSGDVITGVPSSLETENGDLWFGTANGVFVKKGNIWMHYTKDQGLTGNIVRSITQDNDGNFWFGTNGGGVSKFDGLAFTNYTENDGLISNSIFCSMKDRYGNLWFGSDRGVCKYDGKSFLHFTKDQGLSDNFVYSIVEDNHGYIWFGTRDNGVNLYDGNILPTGFPAGRQGQASFTHITHREGLTCNNIRSIVVDKNNNLWLGTMNGGIMKVQRSSFTYFTQFEDISKNEIASITEDLNGNIWFGITGQGLIKYDGESFMELTENEGLDDPFIRYFIYGDRNGNIWFNNNLGLHKYDGNFFTQHYDIEVSGTTEIAGVPSLNYIICMHEDTVGNIWLGTWGEGLKKTDGESFTSFPRTKTYEYVTSVLRDNRGIVWYGTADNGILKYDGVSVTKYSTYEGLSDPNVVSLFEDEADNLWIGTNGGGLNKYDGHSFTHFTEKDGLCNNVVRSIIGDHKGNIWVGTKDGLSLLSPQGNGNHSITSFGMEDGLKGTSFNRNSVCLDNRNRLWWGTGNSVTMLDLNTFEINQDPPVIQLSTVYVNQEYIDFGELLSETEVDEQESSDTITRMKMRGLKFSDVAPFCNYPLDLELPHYLNHLTFNFVATEWSAPQNIQYQFMLEGMDEEWSHLTKETMADYRNIPPGKYTFKVKAISKAGARSESFEYPFIIHRPWWLRWWAITFYAILLILVGRYYVRFIISRERIKAEIQIKQVEVDKMQELDKMKSRFFANISHEFRTPLTLLQGPVEDLLKKEKGEIKIGRDILEIMQRNVRRLQRLINQLLDISKLETGKVKLQVSEGNLEEFVRTITHSFLSLAESKEIRYECNLPETNRIDYFDRDKLEKILTNLISNAFKFTPEEGEIVINLQYQKSTEFDTPQYVEIKVSDTGIGIPDERKERIFDRFYQADDSKADGMEGTGIGLALTKELVDLYRGEIRVESEPGHGSTFSIKLPFLKEQFKDEEIVLVTRDSDEGTEFAIEKIGIETQDATEIYKEEDFIYSKERSVILIVEDNIDLRNYISKNLRKNYQTMVAENGKEGLDSAIENIPDLVISDVMMPEMDGMEMCQKLKTDERTNHIPVILLTARADRGSKLEGLETGADDYLIKPFDAEELNVRVKNLIRQRKILKDKFRKEFIADATDQEVTYEDQMLNKLMGILNNYVSESEFRIDQLADELHMSRRQVFRKVNALTGYTPNEILRNLRLRKAARLFRSGHRHVAQVMHRVGFNSQSYFGKCFQELYGLTPSEYIKQKRV